MVEDELTDGKRIAQFISSELTGLSLGPLADVTVVDANPDVTPTPEGAVAYAIEHAGERIGTVAVRPDAAVVDLDRTVPRGAVADRPGLSIAGDDRHRIVVDRGAAVKAAVDAIQAALEPSGDT